MVVCCVSYVRCLSVGYVVDLLSSALEDVWANTNLLTDLPPQLAELTKLPKLTTVYLHYNKWEKNPQPPPPAAGAGAAADADDAAAGGGGRSLDRTCYRYLIDLLTPPPI